MKSFFKTNIYMTVVFCAVLLVSILIPSQWGPTPLASRYTPTDFNSELIPPFVVNPSPSPSDPTDISVSFSFLVKQRPLVKKNSFLISTAEGLGSGLKVSMDLYGNVYLAIEKLSTVGDYQLIKIMDPGPLNVWNKLFFRIDTKNSVVNLKVNDTSVSIIEPRGNEAFNLDDVRIKFQSLKIGGWGGYNFEGQLSEIQIVTSRQEILTNLVNLKILMFLAALSLAFALLGNLKTGYSGETK